MKVKLRYGRAHLVAGGAHEGFSWRPSRVVDDVLGLRSDFEYSSFLFFYYAPLFWPEGFTLTAKDLAARHSSITEWAKESLESSAPEFFADAATAAASGRLTPGLAESLTFVRHLPNGVVEIDNLLTFAAWGLSEALRKGNIRLETCPSCHRPWLAARGAKFCARPTPDGKTLCRAHEASARYVAKHRDFHRQKRRLYDRMKRGTFPEADYRKWLIANRPGQKGKTWVSYEDWQAGKRPKTTSTKKTSTRKETASA